MNLLTAGNLAELYEVHKQHQALIKGQRDYEQALQDTITRTTEYARTVVLPAATLSRMTETERRAYAEQLRMAQEHYSKLAELTIRQDIDRNGIDAPVSEEAKASLQRAATYSRALKDMQDAHAAREAAEVKHRDTIAKIKADNLKGIQDALGKELLAYEQATKALEEENKKTQAAMKARADLSKEFDQLVKDMRASAEDGPATFGDVSALKAGARQSLLRGDTEGAIRQAYQHRVQWLSRVTTTTLTLCLTHSRAGFS